MDHSEEWACTAQRGDKTFCGAPSVAMAPFPICVAHLSRTYEFLSATLTNEQADDDAHAATEAGLVRPPTLIERPLPPAPMAKTHAPPRLYTAADPPEARVYYLMLGGLVKIGTTGNLRQRIADYPPHSELLTTEPGYRTLEQYRHHQFRRLRAYSSHEWFYFGRDLDDHIDMLKAAA